MDTIRDRAWAAMPDDATRVAVRSALGIRPNADFSGAAAAVTHQPTAPTVFQKLRAEVESMLVSGQVPPADVAAPYLAAVRADELAGARARLMNDVATQWAPNRTVSFTDADAAFEVLREELEAIVDEAEPHLVLVGDLATSADVLERDDAAVTAAWKALGGLAERLRQLRAAQRDIVRKATVSEGWRERNVLLFLEAADALDVHPDLVAYRREPRRQVDAHSAVQTFWAWQRDGHRVSPSFADDLEPARRLVLTITTTEPWVPSMEDLEQAMLSGLRAADKPSRDDLYGMQQARDVYYDVTEVKPVAQFARTSDDPPPAPRRESQSAQLARIREKAYGDMSAAERHRQSNPLQLGVRHS